ncbi:S-layer homology domain-containing protein [Paenibacillus catalpae]|uniref:S-layer homology domain-containing protein n=1 Tax=Paenibacillus catalpae TaxID=1045775 RepID=A0A1I2H471_9BACL|nr:S8 family serine peptidase [Paenibacillus catalpae]SFF24170.1 S-layer homology domain-containing protein [Paenibacillus catalpae]
MRKDALGSLLKRTIPAVLLAGILASGAVVPAPAGMAPTRAAAASIAAASAPAGADEEPQSWLLKWREPAQAHELRGTRVLRRQSEAAEIWLVQPADRGADASAWLARLQSEPGVEYVHPNERVHILASAAAAPYAADDPELAKQSYLKQIGALEAWKTVRKQTNLTIAIVDTGIDLDHPDLKRNLVPGTNFVAPNKPPEDDNGHGTSVAGVIAAAGNNRLGVSGILWEAKLMPIKALDSLGDGTERDLGEAILYAVRHGARIVVLSVGLNRYSPYMLDIVNYAESKGVLLIAAAGNDGVIQGNKAAVKYPAAYPTVLGVGGVKTDNTPDPRSNPGPEVDLAAPWHVYTTAMGGRYKQEEGTSMAAPQVAAAAALVLARYPALETYQVRELLRQTAKDIGPSGLDAKSGYGLLQVNKAVTMTAKSDRFEPNGSRTSAKGLPSGKQITALLAGGSDMDWYTYDAPYNGTITLDFEELIPEGSATPPVRLAHYSGDKLQAAAETKLGSRVVEFKVKKGKQAFLIQYMNSETDQKLPYLMTATFNMAPDSYEQNDKSYEAYTLQPRSQSITGSFHQLADRDWYAVTFTQGGTLSLRVTTDTVRIDSELAVQQAGQTLMSYDEEREGEPEQSPVLTVSPGKYYIRIHNAISTEASPTVGAYTLKMDYVPKYVDPNEPNDKYYEALMTTSGTEYVGVIGSASDVDWFQIRLSQASVVDMNLFNVPSGKKMKLEAYDKKQKLVFAQSTGSSGTLQAANKVLQPGVYYIKLTANAAFDKQYYRFKMKADPLVAGFRDISRHWARDAIAEMSRLDIVSGTGPYTFEPERPITRAEAVAMTVKAYKPIIAGMPTTVRFKDLDGDHWAYGAISKAVQKGWIRGFPDGTFHPEQPVTRAEMALMIGYADQVQPVPPIGNPFKDVGRTHWAAPMLNALKLKGVISGTGDQAYKPGKKAGRAEFTTILYRVYRQ